jgi:cytochrome c oxidase subunit 1
MTAAVFVLGFSSIFTGLISSRPCTSCAPRHGLVRYAAVRMGHVFHRCNPGSGDAGSGITLVLLMMERVFQIGIFDSRIGGDPVLFQHFFWFYSHPAVYIMILPGMAIISELIPTFSRKPSSAIAPSRMPACRSRW